MLEDDLRNFPMSTTGYLQKIRASQRYRDIIAVDELFKFITQVVGFASGRAFRYDEPIPEPIIPDQDKHDYFPPPTTVPPFEDYPVKAIGKLCAISSSKQQPLPAALDELLYRCGTEDV